MVGITFIKDNLGGVYTFIPKRVHSGSLLWFCIRLHHTTENVVPERVIAAPVRVFSSCKHLLRDWSLFMARGGGEVGYFLTNKGELKMYPSRKVRVSKNPLPCFRPLAQNLPPPPRRECSSPDCNIAYNTCLYPLKSKVFYNHARDTMGRRLRVIFF